MAFSRNREPQYARRRWSLRKGGQRKSRPALFLIVAVGLSPVLAITGAEMVASQLPAVALECAGNAHTAGCIEGSTTLRVAPLPSDAEVPTAPGQGVRWACSHDPPWREMLSSRPDSATPAHGPRIGSEYAKVSIIEAPRRTGLPLVEAGAQVHPDLPCGLRGCRRVRHEPGNQRQTVSHHREGSSGTQARRASPGVARGLP